MPRGGARPGAGRKTGSPNRRTRVLTEAIIGSGKTPLEVILDIMRAPLPKTKSPQRLIAARQLRFDAAKAAAPYCHPKLANVEHSGPDGGPLTIEVVNYDD